MVYYRRIGLALQQFFPRYLYPENPFAESFLCRFSLGPNELLADLTKFQHSYIFYQFLFHYRTGSAV